MKAIGSICLSIAFLIGCGEGNEDSVGAVATVTPEYNAMIPVSISVSEAFSSNAALSLAAAQAFSGSISGCSSGYAKAIDQTTGSVNVMDGDTNCIFKLSSLTFGGELFAMAGSEGWAVGSVFSITGNAGSLMTFRVLANLASPISGAQTVSVLFTLGQQGASQSVAAGNGTNISVSGADPIRVDVVAKAASVDGADGAGLFSFKLDCASDLVGSLCEGVDVSALKIALGRNTYGGSLSVDQCRSLATSGSSGTVIAKGADGLVPHGGLATGVLKGPATLFAAENASLVMAIADPAPTGGCKYFLISISAP